jgi:hypothetical protein
MVAVLAAWRDAISLLPSASFDSVASCSDYITFCLLMHHSQVNYSTKEIQKKPWSLKSRNA